MVFVVMMTEVSRADKLCDAADVNGDGVVDPLDSGYVLARFGCPVGTGDGICDSADANADGQVDPLDTGFILSRFGCPVTAPTPPFTGPVFGNPEFRVVFKGGFCEQPPFDMVRMLGRSCYVVDDDFLIGLRWILEDVPTKGDPIGNLAEAYLERSSYSPVQHDLRKPKEEMLIQRIERARADAVIVAAAKMCEPGLEEQVAYTHALDEKRIAYFVSEFEENMTSFEHLEMQVETFLENLLFA